MSLSKQLIDEICEGKKGMTKGMRNAFNRTNPRKAKCNECGTVIPCYPGRYPIKCPECSYVLEYGDTE